MLGACSEPSKLKKGYFSFQSGAQEDMVSIKSFLDENKFSYYTYVDDNGEWIAYPSNKGDEFNLLTSIVLELPPRGYTGSCIKDEQRQKLRSENMEVNGVDNIFRYEKRRDTFCIYWPEEMQKLVENIDPQAKAVSKARERAIRDGRI